MTGAAAGAEGGDGEIDHDAERELGLERDLGLDVDAIEAEELAAARRRSSIEAGRRKGGVLGAAMAGAMLGLRDIYEAPPQEDDIVVVAETPGGPGDIDVDGITGTVGDVGYWAPPPSPPD